MTTTPQMMMGPIMGLKRKRSASRTVARGLFGWFVTARRVHTNQIVLSRLNDRALRDIGLTRGDVRGGFVPLVR